MSFKLLYRTHGELKGLSDFCKVSHLAPGFLFKKGENLVSKIFEASTYKDRGHVDFLLNSNPRALTFPLSSSEAD